MTQRRGRRATTRLLGRWRSLWPLAVGAWLVLVLRVLADEVGSPVALLRALGGLDDPWADPVTPVLALLGLLAQALAGYVLVVLALGSLCALPGWVGGVAGRITLLVTPAVVRHLVDLLVGGTLLAQAALAATPGLPHGHLPGPALALAGSSTASGWTAPGPGSVMSPPGPRSSRARQVLTGLTGPVVTRPVPRRSAVPLPPWLGGGPSNTSPGPTDASPGAPGTAPGPTDAMPGPTDMTASGPTGPTGPRPTGPTAPGPTGPGRAGPAAGYTVALGDTLWDIAAAHLAPSERTVPVINRYWRQMYRANRSVIGVDPDLIHPGTRLDVPPFRRERA